jgi:hypothetical protein
MYLIGDKTDIEAYIAKVDAYNGYKGDTTATWCEPRKHPNKELYAVQKNMSVAPDSTMTEKEELPGDWYPDETL